MGNSGKQHGPGETNRPRDEAAAGGLREDVTAIVDAATAYLRPRLEASPELRLLVHALGRWLCAEAGDSRRLPHDEVPPDSDATGAAVPSKPVEKTGEAQTSVNAPAGPVEQGKPLPPKRSGFVPLKIGDLSVQIKVEGSTEELGRARLSAMPSVLEEHAREPATKEIDLSLVVTRSRLKAEACRTVNERRVPTANAAAMNERVADMLRRGKALPECFLWMFWRERPTPDAPTLERIAACYEAHAAAAEAVLRAVTMEETNPKAYDAMVRAFQAFATANSALRVSMGETWLTSPDRDQDEGHLWLRSEAFRRSVYVRRHMQLDDSASPEGIAEVRSEIEAIQRELGRMETSARVVDSEIGKIKYHAKRLRDVGPEEWAEHAAKISAALERFVASGHQPDDQQVLDMLGDEGARRATESGAATGVLAKIAAAMLRPVDDTGDQREVRAWSERVRAIRERIAGTTMVVVGGERRRDAEQRLTEAFGLSHVEWISLTEHSSAAPMAAPISRPEVSVVVVLIKLAGHHHVDEAVEHASRAGKPLVRVKAGYNPEQIAEAILTQAGQRLGGPPIAPDA